MIATSQNSGIVATIITHFQLSWLYNAKATRRGVLDNHGRWALNSRARSGYQCLVEEDFCWVTEVLMK